MSAIPELIKKTIVLVPTLNEEAGIAEVVRGFKKQGVHDVIVADGGSTDKTRKIARKCGARVLRVPRGKGNGFRSCLSQIKINPEKIYVMIDGDASYSPSELPLLLKKIDSGADVVIGRRHKLVHDFKSFVHVLGNLAISIAGSVFYFAWNPDICTGYWAFTGKALQKIKDKLTAKGFELEADLFSTICRLGLRLNAVRVSYVERKGESKLVSFDSIPITFKLIENRFKKV